MIPKTALITNPVENFQTIVRKDACDKQDHGVAGNQQQMNNEIDLFESFQEMTKKINMKNQPSIFRNSMTPRWRGMGKKSRKDLISQMEIYLMVKLL